MFTRPSAIVPYAPPVASRSPRCYGNRVGGYENGSAYYPAHANGFRELLPSFYNVLATDGYRGAMAGKCDVAKARRRRSVPTDKKAAFSRTTPIAAGRILMSVGPVHANVRADFDRPTAHLT